MSLQIAILVAVIVGALFLLIAGGSSRKRWPPGPRGLPIIGNLHILGAQPHRRLSDLARKYGPIMSLRLGRIPTIVVSSPDAAKLFLKTHDIRFAGRPKLEVAEYFSYGRKGMALTNYGPLWRKFRRLCVTSLLSPSKIESFAGLRREEVGEFVRSLRGAAGAREVVDVSKKVAELVEEMTCRMLFGRSGDKRFGLQKITREITDLMGSFNIGDYVPFLAPLDLQGLSRRIKATSKELDKALEAIIDDHLKDSHKLETDNQPEDFVGSMLEIMKKSSTAVPGDEPAIDRENIKAVMTELFAGAFESLLATVEWTLSELIRHPKAMRRFQDELKSVVGMERIVEEGDIPKLEYFDLVVKEALRLHPAGPLMIPHESMEDVNLDGYYIPKNVQVIINVWAIGRDLDAWSENAEEFLPERFIGSNVDLQGMDFQLLPFGTGRRSCPGTRLGLTMVRFIVAQLVHCFDWELPNGTPLEKLDMAEKFGQTMLRANHLLALPTYRLNVEP